MAESIIICRKDGTPIDVSNYGVTPRTREDDLSDEARAKANTEETEQAFKDLDIALKNMVDVIDNDVIKALYSLGGGGKSLLDNANMEKNGSLFLNSIRNAKNNSDSLKNLYSETIKSRADFQNKYKEVLNKYDVTPTDFEEKQGKSTDTSGYRDWETDRKSVV